MGQVMSWSPLGRVESPHFAAPPRSPRRSVSPRWQSLGVGGGLLGMASWRPTRMRIPHCSMVVVWYSKSTSIYIVIYRIHPYTLYCALLIIGDGFWHWVYLINLSLGNKYVPLTFKHIPRSRRKWFGEVWGFKHLARRCSEVQGLWFESGKGATQARVYHAHHQMPILWLSSWNHMSVGQYCWGHSTAVCWTALVNAFHKGNLGSNLPSSWDNKFPTSPSWSLTCSHYIWVQIRYPYN
jgi:hypothetical protein